VGAAFHICPTFLNLQLLLLLLLRISCFVRGGIFYYYVRALSSDSQLVEVEDSNRTIPPAPAAAAAATAASEATKCFVDAQDSSAAAQAAEIAR
jgi:hypothetical protein